MGYQDPMNSDSWLERWEQITALEDDTAEVRA